MTWREMSELPCDGDSVWLVIREWDRKNYHVDYAIVFFDTDGPIVKRYESDEYEHWPPNEAIAWMECSMPRVPPGIQTSEGFRTRDPQVNTPNQLTDPTTDSVE